MKVVSDIQDAYNSWHGKSASSASQLAHQDLKYEKIWLRLVEYDSHKDTGPQGRR